MPSSHHSMLVLLVSVAHITITTAHIKAKEFVQISNQVLNFTAPSKPSITALTFLSAILFFSGFTHLRVRSEWDLIQSANTTHLCSSLLVSCEMLLVFSECKKPKESGMLQGKGHRKESMTETKGIQNVRQTEHEIVCVRNIHHTPFQLLVPPYKLCCDSSFNKLIKRAVQIESERGRQVHEQRGKEKKREREMRGERQDS